MVERKNFMKKFILSLFEEILLNQYNNLEVNYNEHGFEIDNKSIAQLAKGAVKKLLHKMNLYRIVPSNVNLINSIKSIEKYLDNFSFIYDALDDDYSKSLLIKLLAYRIMGGRKVRLPLNNPEYWEGVREIRNLVIKNEQMPIKFENWTLDKIDLKKKGHPLTFYSLPETAYSIWILKQYEGGPYKEIKANRGDIVIDAGGGWGDTALYFSHNIGKRGRVYTFEINPRNIEIMKKNFDLNSDLRQNIEIVKMALWYESYKNVHFSDNGPASTVKLGDDKLNNNLVKTITIDDFFKQEGIEKVDFIKMDIEGAELNALQGAKETIRKFKPKLAISLYHSISEFANIPILVKELNHEYKLYLHHFQVGLGETVLFAG